MEYNFIRVERHRKPEELLKAILRIVPEFESRWEGRHNCFRSDDGSFSVHGIFAELTAYVRECFSPTWTTNSHTTCSNSFRRVFLQIRTLTAESQTQRVRRQHAATLLIIVPVLAFAQNDLRPGR
jgi:hypothetical protein